MFRDASGPFGDRTWRLPTRRAGTWVAVSVDLWAMPTLARIDEHGTTRTHFGPSCTPTQSRERAAAANQPADTFGDDDLAALMSDGTPGVIYVWSPHMPLSVDAYHHVVRATADLGVTMTALLDRAVDLSYAESIAASAAIPEDARRTFRSVELTFRNATVHARRSLSTQTAVYSDWPFRAIGTGPDIAPSSRTGSRTQMVSIHRFLKRDSS